MNRKEKMKRRIQKYDAQEINHPYNLSTSSLNL